MGIQDSAYSTCVAPSFLKETFFFFFFPATLQTRIVGSSFAVYTYDSWWKLVFVSFLLLMGNALPGVQQLLRPRWSGRSSARSWDLAVFCCHHHNLPFFLAWDYHGYEAGQPVTIRSSLRAFTFILLTLGLSLVGGIADKMLNQSAVVIFTGICGAMVFMAMAYYIYW